jgi:hypothetical protein
MNRLIKVKNIIKLLFRKIFVYINILSLFILFGNSEAWAEDGEGWADILVLPVNDVDEGITIQIVVRGPMEIPTDALNIMASLRSFLTLSIDGEILGWIGGGAGKKMTEDALIVVPAGYGLIFNLPLKEHEVYLKEDSILDKPIRVTHSSFPGVEGFFEITKDYKVVPVAK